MIGHRLSLTDLQIALASVRYMHATCTEPRAMEPTLARLERRVRYMEQRSRAAKKGLRRKAA